MVVRPKGASAGELGRESFERLIAPRLRAHNISHAFPTDAGWLPVLKGVDLAVGAGELVSMIGPSGCGKSTLLSILAGLIAPREGAVWADGGEVTGRVGRFAYMPQKDLLLPWRTALDNAMLPLQVRGVGRARAREEAQSWFSRFGLGGFERHYPATLSGGMRQRVALLRTFLVGRDVLLLDEPLGALDALTRLSMQEWLLEVWAASGTTIVLVTHDVDEAIFLSDRVGVLSPRPARVLAVREVPFARPRRYEEMVTAPAFSQLKRDLLALLRQQPAEGTS